MITTDLIYVDRAERRIKELEKENAELKAYIIHMQEILSIADKLINNTINEKGV